MASVALYPAPPRPEGSQGRSHNSSPAVHSLVWELAASGPQALPWWRKLGALNTGARSRG